MGRAIVGLTAILFIATTFSPLVHAEYWNRTCITTAGVGVEYALLCDGFCSPSTLVWNNSKICENGCNNLTQSCETAYNVPSEFFILAIIAFLGMAGLFIVIANKFKDDWGIVPILFYAMAIIFILMSVGVMGSYFVYGQNAVSGVINTAYLAVGLMTFMFLAYIVLRFILAFALKFLADTNKRRGP